MNNIVKKNNLDDQIIAAIKDAILEGEWKVGDKIPSETQLANMFQTSRPTVRVAIQKLNTMGLLETKVGAGTFVKNLDFSEYLDTISDLISTPEMMNDVVEFRKTIETACIPLVIDRASNEELDGLRQLSNEYVQSIHIEKIDESVFQTHLATMDYNIHYRICELSGNSLFALAYAAAQGTLKQYFYANLIARLNRYRQQNDLEGFINSSRSHTKLVDAIIARDKPTAISIASNIIDYRIAL